MVLGFVLYECSDLLCRRWTAPGQVRSGASCRDLSPKPEMDVVSGFALYECSNLLSQALFVTSLILTKPSREA